MAEVVRRDWARLPPHHVELHAVPGDVGQSTQCVTFEADEGVAPPPSNPEAHAPAKFGGGELASLPSWQRVRMTDHRTVTAVAHAQSRTVREGDCPLLTSVLNARSAPLTPKFLSVREISDQSFDTRLICQ